MFHDVCLAMKLGMFLKDQVGKTVTVNFNVISHLDAVSEEHQNILEGMEHLDTLTKTLTTDADFDEILKRIEDLDALINVGRFGRSYYFEGFCTSGPDGPDDRLTVSFSWGS
jgi:hypothetical protein